MTPDEATYRAWKERVFGNEYSIWHDGLYTGAVTGLTGAAREEALAMLRYGVERGDSHASEALAAMKVDDAVPSLRAQLARLHGAELVRTALALHALTGEAQFAEALIDVLETAGSWSDRIDAAMGLRKFSDADSEERLLRAVTDDPEYLVRYHACESLLARWGVRPAGIAEHGEIFRRIVLGEGVPFDAAARSRLHEARAMLEEMRERRRGRS